MRAAAALLSLSVAAGLSIGPAGHAEQARDEVAVAVENLTEPVSCAEKDNVHLSFRSPVVRAFRVQARHPDYIRSVVADRVTPDWTDCDMSRDPTYPSEPKRVSLYESAELRLIGHTYPSFWRSSVVPARVGARVEPGLHLLQLWVRDRDRMVEVLAFYPQDGYWRARPFPPPHLRESAYGSSFLVGPVEIEGRPIVALKSIAFDPATKAFRLDFARGGSAMLRLDIVDHRELNLEVAFEGALPTDRPFAALRSMYVTDFNADAARVRWQTGRDPGWSEASVLDYPGGTTTGLRLGRTTPSRHNTSAPDFVLSRFARGLRDAPDPFAAKR